jgi:hypothetical protein
LLLSAIAPTGVLAAKPIRDAGVRHDSPNYNNGQKLPIEKGDNLKGNPPIGPAKVGDAKVWLGLDDVRQTVYLKTYTLRAVGNHAEVWVANNLRFPSKDQLNPLTADPADFYTYDDCRNDGVRNVITNDQVNYLLDQFDNHMYGIEADWWSTPPFRNGNKSVLPKLLPNIRGLGVSIPQSYYNGEGDNVVILVDNVRDSNFYDANNEHTNSYIAGFYFSVFDDYFDRTVMSVDAWDWIHRTKADPVNDASPDPCTSAPARPFLYESVFAHEYQHLLHHYTDPNEISWVNEGLSDFTEVITGYADLQKHVNEKGHDSHTNAFLGWEAVTDPSWNPIPYESGPENGLPAWGDQGDDEILADYGFAMYFMNYVASQGYGMDFFRAWQHTAANGIDGLNAALAAAGSSDTFAKLFGDVSVSALVDGYLDNGGSTGDSSLDDDLKNDATEATLNINADAHGTAGAPPWGSDYIELGSGASLDSLTIDFDGADHYVSDPQWVVDGDGYFTNPDVFESNYGDNLDISITHPFTVTGAGELSFDHYRAMELGWDFGVVQKSTDGGQTWTSLPCTNTTSAHNVDAAARIVAQLPGYTGPSEDPTVTDTIGDAAAPITDTCQLGAAAGPILIGFRFMTDPAAEFDGWHVRNIQVDGVDVGTPGDLSDWSNELSYQTVDLTYRFALVGINGTVDSFGDVSSGGSIKVFRPTLGAGDAYSLTPEEVADFAGYARVIAIVSGIPDTESTFQYQPYSLMVDGVEKADGA